MFAIRLFNRSTRRMYCEKVKNNQVLDSTIEPTTEQSTKSDSDKETITRNNALSNFILGREDSKLDKAIMSISGLGVIGTTLAQDIAKCALTKNLPDVALMFTYGSVVIPVSAILGILGVVIKYKAYGIDDIMAVVSSMISGGISGVFLGILVSIIFSILFERILDNYKDLKLAQERAARENVD